MFICCGKKNQVNTTRAKKTAVAKKHFFIKYFLLFVKKASNVLVGNAHSKL